MEINRVTVVGAGTMGSGIVQVCAQAGLTVTMCDVVQEMLDKAMKTIEWSVSKLAEKGKIKDSVGTVMSKIHASTEFQAGANADLVIEAVFEKLAVKHDVFKKFDAITGPDTIMASNTSAIPISDLAGVVAKPENFIGLHFFNPVPMMAVVEIAKGIATNDETAQIAKAFVEFIKKEPILVNRDIAGFVINRINMLSNIEAMRLVENGVASVADIDKGVRLGTGRKMGPLETSDMVGLDIQLDAMTNLYLQEQDRRYYPPDILRRKVAAGHFGRKTGKGWYDYNEDGSRKA
ncbi:MAG: 3-hydroxyacyl-CoA dehydrogenase family protein [Desulfatitalea sp.]|nr:3-hydroxyacyl-CoA dehydrogenase family protein [Desulfatitalea sp.]NNK02728.1 3-hydroxyacyl-CoA dehydrogenase family protein [Desulfatitalea sp.]